MDKTTRLKKKLTTLVYKLEALIDEMPDKGDKCSVSQKMCLYQSLSEFESNINGITDEDLKEDE